MRLHAARGATRGLAVVWLLFAGLAHAAPPLDANGLAGYAEFRKASAHRAFAIAPGGAWSWRGDMPSPELAMRAALDDCRGWARRTCLPYALDAKVIFNPSDWARAWRPYATSAQAGRASVGINPGQRFPDLAWRDQHGKAQSLSAYRGRVVLLHFWGSWCPPCRREMPDLHRLYVRLKAAPDIHMVFLPVREASARSRDWLREHRIAVPVADAGGAADNKGDFRLGDGGRIADRDLARAFPASYVIDRNGIVLFAQVGPVHDWLTLEPLLLDAARANTD